MEMEKKVSVRVGSGETRATEKDQSMHVNSRVTQQEKDINVYVTARYWQAPTNKLTLNRTYF